MAPAITLTIMAGGPAITFKISQVFAILTRALALLQGASTFEIDHGTGG